MEMANNLIKNENEPEKIEFSIEDIKKQTNVKSAAFFKSNGSVREAGSNPVK